MNARVVVLGAGRGSAELLDLMQASPLSPSSAVVLDDRYAAGLEAVAGAPVVGSLALAKQLADQGASVVSGIANSRSRGIRVAIADAANLSAQQWLTFIHPQSTVSLRARIGVGVVIYPGARVAIDAQVHDHAVLYYNAVVHHDAVVGRGAILCAGVLVAGGVRVGAGVYLGIGAVVRDGVTIGENALVGMGAVVVHDVPAGATVKGVPARA